MSTPILTKKQQRQSLSAKKGSAKGLRNILVQPFENYWPTVNIDQYPTLVTLMNELLPLIKRSTFKIPGSMLRHMSKEKRTLARKEALEKEVTKFDVNILKSIILGINAVTRALEKNNTCCVLLDANVEPSLLIKHIVVMAQNKKVPVLLLPILKTITLQTIGFATAAFALKHNVMQSSDNKFYALYKLVADIFKDFKPSKYSMQLLKLDDMCQESEIDKVVTTKTDCDEISNISKPKKSIVYKDVYKYRSSRRERAFIPSTVNQSSQIFETTSNDFIALSNNPDIVDKKSINILKNRRYVNIRERKEDESESKNKEKDNNKSFFNESELINSNTNLLKHTYNHMPEKCKNNNVTYLSLKVKRIQGNNNRLKATKFVKKKKKQ